MAGRIGRFFDTVLFWGGFAAGTAVSYQKAGDVISHAFGLLSDADWAKQAIISIPTTQQMVDRFVAGESPTSALTVAKRINESGKLVSLDYLGEDVAYSSEAVEATKFILSLLDKVNDAELDANLSVKPTQIGLNIREELAFDNMCLILERARQYGNWVRIDMEDSDTTDATLRLYSNLREKGFTNVGVVIQSYLYRSESDVRDLVGQGARVRLCKGAYNESAEVAYPEKSDTDANFVKLMQQLLNPNALANGVKPAIATHDNKMVQATIDYAKENGIEKDAFEFQMLYGVRQELQDHLNDDGYTIRVYVPFGEAWYPYLMRRLAERPANLQFFLSNL